MVFTARRFTFSVLQGDTLHIKAQSVPSYLMCRNTFIDIWVLRDKNSQLQISHSPQKLQSRQTDCIRSHRLGDNFVILSCLFLTILKVKRDHRSKFSNWSNWKEDAWKNQGFYRIGNRDLRDTGAMLSLLYQLSYEATHWKWGQFIEFISSLLISYLNCKVPLPMCGFIAQLVEHRSGVAEVTGSNPVEVLIFSGSFFPIA